MATLELWTACDILSLSVNFAFVLLIVVQLQWGDVAHVHLKLFLEDDSALESLSFRADGLWLHLSFEFIFYLTINLSLITLDNLCAELLQRIAQLSCLFKVDCEVFDSFC